MKLALIQLTSTDNSKNNIQKIEKFLEQNCTQEEPAKYIFLPECFYALSNGRDLVNDVVSENNEHMQNIVNLAKKYKVYLLGGSVVFEDSNKKIKNRALFIDDNGKLIGYYDKRKLFKCNLKERIVDEGRIFSKGNSESVVEINELKIGANICFDLRYPEFFQSYRKKNCNLMTVASAFTVPTGKAHWETLLRARAIETQSFIVASAQWGQNHTSVSTYGHSLVISPWGEVLLNLEEGEKIGYVDIDLSLISEIKSKIVLD